MSLGSQEEANEIFAFALSWMAWKEMEKSNANAAAEMDWHRRQLERWQREPDYYRNPGNFVGNYAYGPNVQEPTLPEGWKFLASGISRRAYLAPSGVVYKVQRNPESEYQGNKGEHETAEKVRRSGNVRGAYIPRTALYKVPGSWVIALEFMDGIRGDRHWDECEYNRYYSRKCTCFFPGAVRCASEIRKELQNKLGLSDLHSENVLWVPKQRVWAVVDLGLAHGGW